ncbi:AraC family transcriptional regulator [Mucilaginibacter sp. S1162]|uniref:AraC family transcriptional regulator n=2 Tax=Mucilaginibacter humi TaxID=2732510 RepID=A0ABX1W493_9SPHI|nr:AraC family transcriptional regulator [Mucilaginibacter humi]
MQDQIMHREHQQRIEAVIDHILKNAHRAVSLRELAEIAHYSPFYFQKLFKEFTGESPKQFTIKVRLETALLFLIIHPYKTLKEIAIECGFSSPAVFSRMVKNYFGLSPEDIRRRSPKERMRLFKLKNREDSSLEPSDQQQIMDKLDIRIRQVGAINGFYLIAPCDDMIKIRESFRKAIQIARANDLDFDETNIYGILSPHQGNIYKTFIAVEGPLPKKFKLTAIKAGKYVCYKLCGDIKENIQAGHYLYHHWLPENGYKIADIIRFEAFNGNPALSPYAQLQREIYLPIEAI